MIEQEEYERIMKGLALLKYLDTHKPDGSDVDGFGKDLAKFFTLLIAHYEYCIKRLNALKDDLQGYDAQGWYQKRRKKATTKLIDKQIKEFEQEKSSINEMLSQL